MAEWSTGVGGLHFWEPSPGNRYECTRISPRGKRYWARLNGVYLGTKQARVFLGTLERCKQLCEDNHRDRQANS